MIGYAMCVSDTKDPPEARHGPGSSLCPAVVLAVTTLYQFPLCLYEPLVTSRGGWSSGLGWSPGRLQGKLYSVSAEVGYT